ncbi:M14 family metallopeptidase [Erythrobacter rubeus]|uniref:Succinylglutamate desuccinylase/aspartoacylase family protein n=1 Tax=Erythrobacter rubeus TaxID=2760803 RepID=A0ABR8KS67_9SPHN|nr:M14 family metallopeptidase [Erythrobacter rubeus]MBD2840961.1 succinylglutamate desuccinylase/aspartoacylase family protein [Erythrobacter rubeus]
MYKDEALSSFQRAFTLLAILLTLSVLIAGRPASAQMTDALTISDRQVEPGTRLDLRLEIVGGEGEPDTFIPVTVLHGNKEGPVLAAVAGVHGFEFASILAADRLADRIDPKDLSGTLILVRVANIPSFEWRTPHLNPIDRKNLNRSFPGDPHGTSTERIANILSREVVARADFLLDLHSGDAGEFLEPFLGVYGGPLSTDFDLALEVAKGFGFPNIVRYSMNTQEQIDTGRSLNRQGVAAGIPTVLVEIGQNGSRKEEHAEAVATGVENALGILDIWNKPRKNVPPPLRLFESTTAVRATHSGLFFPVDLERRYVFEGDFIGTIRDYTGKEVQRLYSPIDGYALYGKRGPSMREGDPVMTIGIPTNAF